MSWSQRTENRSHQRTDGFRRRQKRSKKQRAKRMERDVRFVEKMKATQYIMRLVPWAWDCRRDFDTKCSSSSVQIQCPVLRLISEQQITCMVDSVWYFYLRNTYLNCCTGGVRPELRNTGWIRGLATAQKWWRSLPCFSLLIWVAQVGQSFNRHIICSTWRVARTESNLFCPIIWCSYREIEYT